MRLLCSCVQGGSAETLCMAVITFFLFDSLIFYLHFVPVFTHQDDITME